MDMWNGQIAIVTGGSSGLGAASAIALAERGIRLAIFDINEEAGKAKAAALDGMFCKVDVADPSSVMAGIDAVVAKMGYRAYW